MSDAEWRFFERLRDRIRRDSDIARDVPADVQGTRMALRAWLEDAIRGATALDGSGSI